MTPLNKDHSTRRFNAQYHTRALCTLVTCLSVGGSLLACGAPPPAPVKATPTWAEVVKPSASQAIKPSTVKVTHELWTTSGVVPPLARVEAALASTGVLADASGAEGRYEINVGGNQCKTEWGSLDASLKSRRSQREGDCSGQLSTDQTTSLARATHQMTLTCEGEALAGIVELHNVTVSLAKALTTPHAQEGELKSERLPAPVWVNTSTMICGDPSKLTQFLTQDHVKTHSAALDDGEWVVWTRGLSAFGLSEIALAPLKQAKVSDAKAKLISLSDSALRFDGLQEGATVESGMARGMYVTLKRVAQRLKSLAAAPDEAQAALMVVKAGARVDDRAALKKLAQRFSRP